MTQFARRATNLVAEIRRQLETTSVGQSIKAYDSVTSTNTVAAEWATADAPDGALVLAEFQTRGRGRMGRSWEAHPGLNLTFSIVLRPELPSEQLGIAIIAASVAVADSIALCADPLQPEIKWPNDVLLNGKKCCGMLLESVTSTSRSDRFAAVILGIGLNVNQDSFPDELTDSATSILLESGRLMDRAQLLADICLRIERRLYQARSDSKGIRRAYMSRMADLGEPVRLRYSDRDGGVKGVPLGLHESGGLILETDSGPRVFHAGEVTRSR